MHLSILSPRGGGGSGICRGAFDFLKQIFNQMLQCRALNIGQMAHYFAINCNKQYNINNSHSLCIQFPF